MLVTTAHDLIPSAVSHVDWYHDRYINPYGPNHWTTVKIDQAALISALTDHQITSLLEIGTWEGFTTMCMWTSGGLRRCRSIDLGSEYDRGGSEYHNPDNLKGYGRFFRGVTPVEFVNIDSMLYVPEPGEQWDAVFIDGNHNREYVASDYALATKLARKLILFHDYDNDNPGVDEVLADIARTRPIHWYKGSAVVYVEVTGG
jgi:hypothetical protein